MPLTTGFSKLAKFSKDLIFCWTEKGLRSTENAPSVEKLRLSIAFKYSLDRLDLRLSSVSGVLKGLILLSLACISFIDSDDLTAALLTMPFDLATLRMGHGNITIGDTLSFGLPIFLSCKTVFSVVLLCFIVICWLCV